MISMRPAILLLALLLASTQLVGGDEYLEVDELTMSLDGPDVLLQVNYTLDYFARLYVLALGCKHIEPDLLKLFVKYGDVRAVSVNPESALLLASGAGKYNSGYYLFDSMRLGSKVKKLTVIYPSGPIRTFHNVTATPSVFAIVKNKGEPTS